MKPLNLNKKNKKFIPPTPAQVVEAFEAKDKSPKEAMKFYFYYSSIDWHVGKMKMRSWRAAAAGWVLRMADFAPADSINVVAKIPKATEDQLKEEALIREGYERLKVK